MTPERLAELAAMFADRPQAMELVREVERLQAQLSSARTQLEEIVCVEPVDAGVILKSWDSPTHAAVWDGKPVTVYDYPHFSELGGALIDLWRTIQ